MKNNVKNLNQTEIHFVYGGGYRTLVVTDTPDYYKKFLPIKFPIKPTDGLFHHLDPNLQNDEIKLITHKEFKRGPCKSYSKR